MAELSEDVRAFIDAHLDALYPLEILLLLRARAGAAATPAEVARELRLDAEHAGAALADLAARGFAKSEPGPRYLWSPTPELARGFDAVARAYEERRVAVITAIFSRKQTSRVQLFADAFRFRKERK